MSRKGLLIEYEYCTGCQSCLVACKQEHNYPVGICGLKLNEIYTPPKSEDDRLRIDFLPFPTKHCDLCENRVTAGGKTACEKACQAAIIWHGNLNELAALLEDKPHAALYTPR